MRNPHELSVFKQADELALAVYAKALGKALVAFGKSLRAET
jgi:hypothetical protein